MHDDLHDLHDELAGLLPPLRNHGPCGQPQSLRATARLRLSTYAPPLQRQQLLGQLNPITPGAHRGTRASAPVAQVPASRNCWPGQARAYGARGGALGPWASCTQCLGDAACPVRAPKESVLKLFKVCKTACMSRCAGAAKAHWHWH